MASRGCVPSPCHRDERNAAPATRRRARLNARTAREDAEALGVHPHQASVCRGVAGVSVDSSSPWHERCDFRYRSAWRIATCMAMKNGLRPRHADFLWRKCAGKKVGDLQRRSDIDHPVPGAPWKGPRLAKESRLCFRQGIPPGRAHRAHRWRRVVLTPKWGRLFLSNACADGGERLWMPPDCSSLKNGCLPLSSKNLEAVLGS
jgi:hypothetical protein